MKSSDLNSLLIGNSSGEDLQRITQEEVSSYGKLIGKKGSTIPIYFYEDEEIMLNDEAIKKLLLEALSGNLSNIHLAYICDCLTLGEKVHFENENLKDLIFEIADPEINGGYKTNSELIRIIENLSFDES